MPRKRQPPRLYLREDERVWIIRDGARSVRTGCAGDDLTGAEAALAQYIGEKHTPVTRESSPARLKIHEVLNAYAREHVPNGRPASIESASFNIAALAPFWGTKTLAEVKGQTCREYAAKRYKQGVGAGTVRRELAVLSAAVNYWHREHGPLDSIPVVTLPQKPQARAHYLTRSEAALLLAGALGWYREHWTDLSTREEHFRWRRDRSLVNPMCARFILLGLYTGTRHAAILGVQWVASVTGGSVNLDTGILYRRGAAENESSKRRGPLKLNHRILAHLRRWNRLDAAQRDHVAAETGQPCNLYLHVVTYEGAPIAKMKKPWAMARELSGLGDHVVPHILRHTRVTWWVQAGLTLEEVADAASMTVQMVEDVYWHHSPQFQQRAARA